MGKRLSYTAQGREGAEVARGSVGGRALSNNDELLLVLDQQGLRRNGQMVLELAKPPSLTAVARDCLLVGEWSFLSSNRRALLN